MKVIAKYQIRLARVAGVKFIPAFTLALSISLSMPSSAQAQFDLPELGENSIINLDYEKKIGQSFYRQLIKRGLVETHPLIDRYINDFGSRLLAGVDNRARDYKFFVLRDDSVNAFALPGGYIGINRGLIAEAKTQHQVASVLAHEIAHVRLRHGLDMLEKSQNLSNVTIIALLAGLLLGGANSEVGEAIFFGGLAGSKQAMINFTRENEYEADRYGFALMQTAEFDPKGMVQFFKIMGRLSGSTELGNIEYLQTHPVSDNRVAEAAARIKSNKSMADPLEDYLLFRDFLRYSSNDHLAIKGSQYLRALALIKRGDFAQADKRLSALHKSKTDNIWYALSYAENLEQLNQDGDAEKVYRRLLEIFPQDYVLSMQLLGLLRRTQRSDTALTIARGLENRYPENKNIYYELSEIYRSLKKPALRLMAEAEFHSLSDNPQQAIKLYDQVINIDGVKLATQSKAREKRFLLLPDH